jgi:hypothetical protein
MPLLLRGQVEDEVRPARRGRGVEPPAVAAGHVGGDGQPAPAAAAAGPRARRELADRRGQAGALVRDLDTDAAARAARAHLHLAPRVLEGVGDEVADRLGEAQAIAAHDGSGAAGRGRDGQLTAVGGRDEPPRRLLVREQLADVHRRRAMGRAPSRARGDEVVERERGAAQLALDRGRGGARARRETRGGQRPAQLVDRARDELAPAAQLAPLRERDAERDAEHRRPRRRRRRAAHAASARTGSTRR